MVAAAGEIAGIDPTPEATERAIRIAAALADVQLREAARRVEAAESRARACDLMAKAMAKDVAEALRRATESDLKVRNAPIELEAATRRAEAAEVEIEKAAVKIAETETRVSEAEARASEAEARAAQLDTAIESAREEAREISSARHAAIESIRRELAAERSSAAALADCKRQLDDELADVRAQLSAAMTRAGVVAQQNIELQRELETADSLRAFAAETEHEIAKLQRELHDARTDLAELVIQRDRRSGRGVRSDSEPTTNPFAGGDEDTVGYTLQELVRRAGWLEARVAELELENARLRDRLMRDPLDP
jgi:chromosome segregation ATPase